MSQACWKDVIAFGGAIMAFVIGAGFASGQEVMQFFTQLGLLRSLGAGAVALAVFMWFSAVILEDGRRLQLNDANDIFAHYCGRPVGLFFQWFVPILLFLVLSIMISGAGATVSEHYGANPNLGRLGMALATLLTVLLGLKRLVHIIGYIGPVVIVFTMALGFVSIAQNPGGLGASGEVLKTINVPRASTNWLFSGLLYAAFSLVGLMPFIAGMGKQAKSSTDTMLGGMFGGATFILGAMILSMGLLADIGEVYDKQIPSLALIAGTVPLMASVFAIMLLASIYTTAVPMLWTACNRIATDESSRRYKLSAIVLVIIACFGGQLHFGTMVGAVYPATGYMGLILLVGMVYTKTRAGAAPAHGRLGAQRRG
jgi:uncharacterized membrane protein YkvI